MFSRTGLINLILATLIFSGCTALTPEHGDRLPGQKFLEESNKGGWWYVRFKIEWPHGAPPPWHIDPLIAHRIIYPVLSNHQKDIQLWRFHRRAARDKYGRQFSFIFYSSPETASRLNDTLKINPLLTVLKGSGIVEEIFYDNTMNMGRPDLEATSDTHWSVPLQKSWPYYIMGVSMTWLHLIDLEVKNSGKLTGPETVEGLTAYYKKINASVTKVWQHEGKHAFLHHLNALFGYEPVFLHF